MHTDTIRQACAIAGEIRDDFLEHVARVAEDADNHVRKGVLGEKALAEIRKGAKADLRPLSMMLRSGKGGPGHEGYLNVTLFDHSLNVGTGAATIAAIDLFGEVDVETLRSTLASIVAIGFAHDIDKYAGKDHTDLVPGDVAGFMDAWKLAAWLDSHAAGLTPEQALGLIRAVEVRESVWATHPSVPNSLYNSCRRYVRTADCLESDFTLHWRPGESNKVAERWKRVREGFENPDRFKALTAITVTDPHHPFLLDRLQQAIGGACHDVSGHPPLFSVQQDATLISYVPEADLDTILKQAVEDVVEQLPFGPEVFIRPQGNILATGRRILRSEFADVIRQTVLSSGGMGLLYVKNVDVLEGGETNAAGKEIARLASAAGCPAATARPTAKMSTAVASPGENDDSLEDVVRTAAIAFLIGVQAEGNNKKAFDETTRQALILEAAGAVLPDWAEPLHPVTRRTAAALAASAALRARGLAWFPEDNDPTERLLGPDGMFAGKSDKGAAVTDAVRIHLKGLVSGILDETVEGVRHCIVTGMPVGEEWKIEATDKLHGLKSSAMSYREGRSEDRFRETADAHLSPVSYAEYRLRAMDEDRKGGLKGGVPVRLCSTTSSGLFGTQLSRGSVPNDISTYDALRADRQGTTISPLESYVSPLRIGRFEELPSHFSERVAFFKRCLQAAVRIGRPIHVFQGLPVLHPAYFASDCLGREIRSLIGGDSLRIEQVESAVRKLEVVEYVARPRREKGLGNTALAKALCIPGTAFEAACLAWWIGTTSDEKPDRLVTELYETTIPQEIARMSEENRTPAVLELAAIARTVQKAPMYDDPKNRIHFMVKTAFEACERAYRTGMRDPEELVAAVGGAISEDSERATSSAQGFYASAANRPAGKTIQDQIDAFARHFVKAIWTGLYHGRPPTRADRRHLFATYAYAFRNNRSPKAA